MDLRCASNPKDVKHYTTERLREEFHISGLFTPDIPYEQDMMKHRTSVGLLRQRT